MIFTNNEMAAMKGIKLRGRLALVIPYLTNVA